MVTGYRRVLWVAMLGAAAMLPASTVHAGGKAQKSEKTAERPAGSSTAAQSLAVAQTASGGEIELASVASSKAQSDAVQKVAQTTINDHTQENQKARALAEKLGVHVTPSAASNALQKEADDATARVEKTSGPEFDRAYLEGTIRFHQKVLKVIDETALRAGSPELKAFFAEQRDRVEHELELARAQLASLK